MKRILQNQQLRFLLIVAAVLISGVGIAYAIFQTTLTITFNKVTQNAITWDIGFDTSGGTSVTATAAGTSATGRSCGTATLTANSVSVAATTVSKPGDKCTYTLTIKNNGTVPGTLTAITPTNPSGSGVSCTQSGASITCGKVKYSLTTDAAGSTLLTTGGSALAANASRTIYLVIAFNGNEAQTTAVTQTNAKFTLKYEG